jgi:hypothetical protein
MDLSCDVEVTRPDLSRAELVSRANSHQPARFLEFSTDDQMTPNKTTQRTVGSGAVWFTWSTLLRCPQPLIWLR